MLYDSIYMMFKIRQNKLMIIEFRIVISLKGELAAGKGPNSGTGMSYILI